MRRVKLRVLECGHCLHASAMTRKGASWRPTEFPSLVGVIEHPVEGIVLFDTGYDPLFLAATDRWPEKLYRMATPVRLAPGESAVQQLAALGVQSEDVRHIVISHFHGDHVAGLGQFPKARLHCSRAGLSEVRRPGRLDRTRRGVLAALVPSWIEEAAFFEDQPRLALPTALYPLEAGADLFGDGSLIAVELPGHCPGHWGLALKLEDDRHTMLVADAAWSLAAIEQNSPPPAFTTHLLGKTDVYRATLSALHTLSNRCPETVLLPSHCREASKRAGLLP